LTTTTEVENWPGDTEVQGPDLMVRMEAHARAMGCAIVGDIISELDVESRPFVAKGDSGATYTADAVILATGARAKWLGLPSEEAFKGFGVSASKVTLIHRRDELRAEKILQDRLFKNPKIEPLWFHTLDEVFGTDNPKGVEGVRVRHVETGEITEIPCKGVFIAIGHAPASELVKGKVEMHHGDYVRVEPGSTRTSVPGLFAAGDLTDHVYRQAVTSAGMGCMAALDAERFLAEQED
jgi:thioredoxin reductase (NADPH)